MAETKTAALRTVDASPARVSARQVVSAPGRIIQVERLEISEEQRAAVASAIRFGRESVRIRK